VKHLVTGGAGFIGRWVVKALLDAGHEVWVLDNLSNGSERNLAEFRGHPGFRAFVRADIRDLVLIEDLFQRDFDTCLHLAAKINVQDSIDRPYETFENDVVGTFNILQACLLRKTRLVYMSTCMVYDGACDADGIDEKDRVKPASPYAAAKLAGEHLVLSYYHAYGLPTVVIRPFNTYGPYQKCNGEGGVISIFLAANFKGEEIRIYGNGTQTRDFLFVTDCADFVVCCGESDAVVGEVINVGFGRDITIAELARVIAGDSGRLKHVPHIHPQSEIPKLLCNPAKATHLLGWRPTVSLAEGVARTGQWIAAEIRAGNY